LNAAFVYVNQNVVGAAPSLDFVGRIPGDRGCRAIPELDAAVEVNQIQAFVESVEEFRIGQVAHAPTFSLPEDHRQRCVGA
jgi:hypothetical protein